MTPAIRHLEVLALFEPQQLVPELGAVLRIGDNLHREPAVEDPNDSAVELAEVLKIRNDPLASLRPERRAPSRIVRC